MQFMSELELVGLPWSTSISIVKEIFLWILLRLVEGCVLRLVLDPGKDITFPKWRDYFLFSILSLIFFMKISLSSGERGLYIATPGVALLKVPLKVK